MYEDLMLGELGHDYQTLTYGEVIFGKGYNRRHTRFFGEARLRPEEAQEILDAMVHPELRKVVDSLEMQMDSGAGKVSYSLDEENSADSQSEGRKKTFLFGVDSYRMGLVFELERLLERAHPDFRASEGCETGKIFMKKRRVMN